MDEQPDLIAALDQTRAGLGTLAGVLGSYFSALVGEGFTRAEALTLVAGYQHLLWVQAQGADAADADG